MIVRLHETRGGRATGVLRADFATTVTEVDLLDRDPRPAGDRLSLGPFQITTLRLTRES
ncbi:glycosyl hydrolase-related protein [Paractinoplanes maris]|uniref:glycosyl hydrolase-related protein n=1 Tax=Paractinoplanes maris TaxID=1734446 RepID=UPI00202160DF|nr:glycosyl hydrolase-related protein [Actinoplanes maris]